MRVLGFVAAAAFVASVWLANWLVVRYGVVSIGFGLEAPAGVFAAGLAFTLRDLVQRTLGRPVVVLAIVAGCGLAYWVGAGGTVPGGLVPLAVASAVAFVVSELADLGVYSPLQERSFVGAVVVSNTVGVLVDSALFLWLAFGSLVFVEGQVVGKLYMTVLALPFLFVSRRWLTQPA